jgi:putative ABC transport system ATP-binding protein
MAVIELREVVKTYKMGQVEVRALDGVSFGINKGEIVAIMGPSGSGKSTILNILGCLDNATSGKYFLDGAEVNGLSDHQLANVRNRKIGFVFQQFNLLARTSTQENVALPLLYGNGADARRRTQDVLEKVGMSKRSHHTPSQMSGGEQQRVAIARALINKPAIILADEPTGNLDSRNSAEIINLLLQLNRDEGITIILVTHDPEIGERTQRIISFRDGKIADDRRLGAVKANP